MGALRAFFARLKEPLIRERRECDLALELDAHLQMMTDENLRAGLPAEEARRRARIALGGMEGVKEECRDARHSRWLDDLWHDFRYALRNLRHKPVFAAVAISTLGLGIGATTVMFTVIDSVLLKPLPYAGADRLLAVDTRAPQIGEVPGFSFRDFDEGRRGMRTLSLAAWTYGGGTVREGDKSEYVPGRAISSELLSVLRVPLLAGRSFLPSEDHAGAAPVAIIGEGLWQRYFGRGPAAIGSRLLYDGKPYTVVGVVPAWLRLDDEAGVFTPLAQLDDPRMHNGSRFIHVLGRLNEGTTPLAAQAELSRVAANFAKAWPRSNAGIGFAAHPLKNEVVGNVGSSLWLLLSVVSVVLLIACANVASLMLARAVSREREIAMRVALGAGRSRVVRLALTESCVLALAGGALGTLLGAAGIHPFVKLWPGSLPRSTEIAMDWRVMLFALAASLLTGLLFGIIPALRAPARDLEQWLRSGGRTVAGATRRIHSGFVVAEIALAIILLIAAGTLGRTLLELSHRDPGIDVQNVFVSRLSFAPERLTNSIQTRAAWQEVIDRTRNFPGVKSAALADVIPMRVGENVLPWSASPSLPAPSESPVTLASSVTPDYLKVMGIRLLEGRFFADDDRSSTAAVVVIDRSMAHDAFGTGEAVGRRLWIPALGKAPVEVVGVVDHVRNWGLADDDESKVHDELYYALAQVPDQLTKFFSSILSIAVRTDVDQGSVIEPLRRELSGGSASLYQTDTMAGVVKESLARQRFLMVLLGIFASLALLLASIGIYGVLTYLISQRVPEIGVRMALGASGTDVLQLVLRQSLAMVSAGVMLGIAGALASGRLLQKLVAGAQPADSVTIAAMVAVLVAVALFASFLPARRASRVDPMKALRQE